MTDVAKTGGCLCGGVRYTLAEPPAEFGACHCGMCRRFSGGVMMALEIARDGVTFDKAETLATYASSDWAERGFCGTCGSSLFWRMTVPGPMADKIMVCAGTLDRMDGLDFAMEVYVDSKPDAYTFSGDRTRMTEAEILAMAGVGTEGATQ